MWIICVFICDYNRMANEQVFFLAYPPQDDYSTWVIPPPILSRVISYMLRDTYIMKRVAEWFNALIRIYLRTGVLNQLFFRTDVL